ncbi:MAG: TolC family outer membrane protein [Alphaproteobacteria bacterium]|nr:TolC family outer membrane protein [Alphaproteobacteria bacterium]
MCLRLGRVSAAALITGLFFGAGGAVAENLENEIVILLADNPEIQSLRNQVEASEEGVNIAFAGFLPQIDVSGDYGYEYTDSTNPGDSLDLTRNLVTATLRQRLFDGYGKQAVYGSAQLSSDIANVNLDSQTQALIFLGVRAYLNVLRAQSLIDLSTRNVGVIQTQLDLETERVERGSGITLDELQAKSRLQIAQERRVAFEGTLEQAIARYNRIFGHEPDLANMQLPNRPMGELPGDLDTAIGIALAENPQGENSELAVNLADEGRVSARSAYWPTLDLVGRLNWEHDVAGTIGIRRDAAVIVEANWQLFAGFANQAGVAQSAYQYVASVHDRTATCRLIVQDTELAWERWQTAVVRVALLENAVAIAEEVHASRVRLRDAGQETVLNVLDSENEVFNAQINQVTAQYDGYIAVYALLQAMGRLTADRLGVDPDLASMELDDGAFAVAASADASTVALATAVAATSEPEVEVEVVTAEVMAMEPVEVEIAADAEPIAWPESEPVVVAQVTEAELLEPSPEPVESMTAELEVFEPTMEPVEIVAVDAMIVDEAEPSALDLAIAAAEPVATAEPNAVSAALVSTSDLEETTDLNLTRSWSFE